MAARTCAAYRPAVERSLGRKRANQQPRDMQNGSWYCAHCGRVRTASTHAPGAPSVGSSGIAASASAATCSASCRSHKHVSSIHTLAAIFARCKPGTSTSTSALAADTGNLAIKKF